MVDAFPCPKCQPRLAKSGEVVVDGHSFPVFQCDECIAHVEMFGEPVEGALTFAVDADGNPFDPATPDGSLPL
jgi:hypothetical protein